MLVAFRQSVAHDLQRAAHRFGKRAEMSALSASASASASIIEEREAPSRAPCRVRRSRRDEKACRGAAVAAIRSNRDARADDVFNAAHVCNRARLRPDRVADSAEHVARHRSEGTRAVASRHLLTPARGLRAWDARRVAEPCEANVHVAARFRAQRRRGRTQSGARHHRWARRERIEDARRDGDRARKLPWRRHAHQRWRRFATEQ